MGDCVGGRVADRTAAAPCCSMAAHARLAHMHHTPTHHPTCPYYAHPTPPHLPTPPAGRLIQAMRKAGARDPLLLLDEVDKMGRDARGDPAAALLEVRVTRPLPWLPGWPGTGGMQLVLGACSRAAHAHLSAGIAPGAPTSSLPCWHPPPPPLPYHTSCLAPLIAGARPRAERRICGYVPGPAL